MARKTEVPLTWKRLAKAGRDGGWMLVQRTQLADLEARLKAAEAECKRLRHSHKSQRRRKFTPKANQI